MALTFIIQKDALQYSREVIAYKKLACLPNYAGVICNEEKSQISTPVMDTFYLISIDRIIHTFNAIRQLHQNTVIHGDIKPDHIRAHDKNVVFIDFGHSVDHPLQAATGYSYLYASFDSIVLQNVHPLDDYEAVLISCILTLNPALSKNTYSFDHDSIKSWLQWKLSMMDWVYLQQTSCREDIFRFAYQKLCCVWSLPRNVAWLDNDIHNKLCNPSLFSDSEVDSQMLMLHQSCRLQFESTLKDKDITGELKVSEFSEHVSANMLKNHFSTILTSQPRFRVSNKEGTAEFDALFSFDAQTNPCFLMKTVQYIEFPLLSNIPGQILYDEASNDVKTILNLTNKFETLHFRPLQYLLLIGGIHVSCKTFFPDSQRVAF